MKTNLRGQIGPMSLEDIYPMTMAFIIIFAYITYIFASVSGYLERKNSEETYRTAAELSKALSARSVLVYEKKPGLLDAGKLDEYVFLYEVLSLLYGFPGYGFSVEVRDLADASRTWHYGPWEAPTNHVYISTPIAIRYRVDVVHEGLLDLRVWRT